MYPSISMQINIQPCVQPSELRGGPNVNRVVVWYRVDCGMEDSRVSIYEHDATSPVESCFSAVLTRCHVTNSRGYKEQNLPGS